MVLVLEQHELQQVHPHVATGRICMTSDTLHQCVMTNQYLQTNSILLLLPVLLMLPPQVAALPGAATSL